MLFISDLHIKEKEIYRNASMKFLNWLSDNYLDDVLVFSGDLFDSSSINHEIVFEVTKILKQFREIHITAGNHDTSKRMSNILLSLQHHDSIYVYTKETEKTIEGKKCLFLPYQYNMDHYKTMKWRGDLCFAHITPVQEQFNDEGIDTSGIEAKKIFGHIHTASEYENGDLIIPGVPLKTRNGEQNNPILEIKGNTIIKIEVPKFFDICDIEFGDGINLDYLYNIKNAPSYEALYKMYPAINIREEGVTLIQKDDEGTNIDFKFKEDSLKDYFVNFCREKELSRTIASTGIKYMEKYS